MQHPIILCTEVVGTYWLIETPVGMVRHSFADRKPWPAPEWTWWLCHESFLAGLLTNFETAWCRMGMLICSFAESVTVTP